MSWIDISVGSGSSGQGSSNNLLSGFINSLGNALSNASASGGLSGFPKQLNNENDQIVGYYDDPQGYYSVIKKFLSQKNYHSNERLKSAFERIINQQNRINQLNQEMNNIQNHINNLNNGINHLNQEIQKQNQALNSLNQEIAGLNNEITANENAIKQEQEKLNALELQTNAKKEIRESLKKLEELKQNIKRLKEQSKWKKQFNFLTDNPPNIQAKQENALNRASNKNALMNFFLTDPYAILPKGFIYEYHNPGKETYNALNAPNNMDGINNHFKTNALNQVLDNSYQKFLAGNDSYNALGDIEQVKALKFYDLVINLNSLMKIIKGQKGLTNYQVLTKGLPESDKERLELSMLNRLMEQSLKQAESLKVFDSAQFFNQLNEFKDDVFTTPKAKEYIDIASGFHKLFKNDAKIALSLKPATTKNLSQGLATTLSGALKYQWTKFTLGTLYRNAPDRILGVKLPKALNEATAGAALKYHIKRALERSHSISEFSKNLELSVQNAKFSNNTLKIIEELNNGIKQASEEIKEKATKYEKALQELQKIDESKLTKEQKQVLKVFKGELDEGEIKKIDLNDLYILDQGTRHAGAKKILVKHYGAESTGGLTNDELINMSEVIKNGSVLLESFERLKNGFRYGYEWEHDGVKLRLVVDDLNDGNKIFDFYSDRNFKDFRDARPQPSTSKDSRPQPTTLDKPNPT
ncbi:DUF3519 domain-containing protein, partial [Helicobacter pylori]